MALIDEAVKAILETYGDPVRVAKDYIVDPADIETALAQAEPDGSTAYALKLLASVQPVAKPAVKKAA